MTKDQFMLRIQNLADPYDKAEATQVKVKDLATHISQYLNSENVNFKLTETSITGNMPVEEMNVRRAVWKTVDDDKPEFQRSKISHDSGDVITMEPQRIRVFLVDIQKSQDLLQ